MVRDVIPNFLPSGYRLISTVRGSQVLAFGHAPSQVGYVYATDRSSASYISSIQFFAAQNPDKRELTATENHAGSPVEIGNPPRYGVYHDGWWAPGYGPDQREFGPVVFHWDTSAVHSITIDTGELVLAIRAPRDSVDRQLLTEIAQGLSF